MVIAKPRARRALLLVALLSLGACPDTSLERVEGRAEAAVPEVSVSGLLGAMTFFADTASDRNTSGRRGDHWTALRDATWRAMHAADAGDLSAEDEELLRSRVVPLFASLSLSQQKAEAFQPWCEPAAEEGDTFRFILKSSLARGPRDVPARWEGSYEQGFADLFSAPTRAQNDRIRGATCGSSALAYELVRQSILQALTNLLQMRVILLEGEVEQLQSSPASYASWLLGNSLPSGLGSFTSAVEPDLQAFAGSLSDTLDHDRAFEARDATYRALRTVAANAGAEIRRQKGYNPEWDYGLRGPGGRFDEACPAIVRQQAHDNVLLTTPYTMEQLCSWDDKGNRSKPDWRPIPADLPRIVDDLAVSVGAYLSKLDDAWSGDGGAETVKKAAHHNLAGISAVIEARPECMARLCTLLEQAAADRASREFWQGVILWGTAIIGIAALVTGVGALAVGAAGFVGVAAGLGTATTVLASIGSAATLAGAIYLGASGARELAEAETDLAALLVSGADPRSVQADWEHGVSLVQGALIDGVLSIADLAVMVRALRASAAGRRGVDLLEREVRNAEEAAVAAERAAVDAARAAAVERGEVIAFADSLRDLPKSQRPKTVARLSSASESAQLGRSGFCGTNHRVTQTVLDDLEEAARRGTTQISNYHGHCAEVDTINQALRTAEERLGREIETLEEAREILRGSEVQTAQVWREGAAKSARHGMPLSPCDTCRQLLERLGVAYH